MVAKKKNISGKKGARIAKPRVPKTYVPKSATLEQLETMLRQDLDWHREMLTAAQFSSGERRDKLIDTLRKSKANLLKIQARIAKLKERGK
jgi:hypothetical protein